MEKETKRGFTRRWFLKNTVTGAGATAVVGGGSLTTKQVVAQTASSVQAPKYSWETPPNPVPDSNIKEKINTEILVIGCGISGGTAAVSASEAGAKVIVIEKHTTYNCRGKDNAAIDTRFQKKLGINIDKDLVCLALQKYSGNRSDQRLLRLWADNSGKIMDWLSDMTEAAGYETIVRYWPLPEGYDVKTEYYPQFPVDHNFSGGQDGLMKTLLANAEKRGVEVRYNTRAVQLVRKNKGRVTGVIAQDKDGNYLEFNASKAVILCTGEYGHDKEMMTAYCPGDVDFMEDSPYDPPVNTGDGHKMAMWIGGVLEPAPHPPMDHSAGGPLGNSAFLHVNNLGERYENEDLDCQVIANAMKRQPGKTCWQVYDSKYESELPKMGFGFLKGTDSAVPGGPAGGPGGTPGGTPGGARGGIPGGAQAAGSRGFPGGRPGGAPGGGPGGAPGGGAIGTGGRSLAPPMGKKVQADTIEELAKQMEVPVETFKATIARYNELAKLGKDLDFGKRADRLTTIEKPPFYAGQAVIGFLVALGGMYVNTKLQLLDEERKPIAGIYLAGNTVGNRFANDYTIMCPGLSHAFAWTTGYLAAKNAVAEKV